MENNDWTKNKILMFVLYWVICCFCIWIFVVSTLASDSSWISKGGSNQMQEGELNFNSALVMIEEIQTSFDFENYYRYQFLSSIGARDGITTYFMPKDCVMVRSSSVNNDGTVVYTHTCYSYNGFDLVPERFIGRAVVEVGYTSCHNQNVSSFGTADSYDYYTDCPYAINEEYALKYFQTMDGSWLENGDGFVDVPKPMNLSFYLASSENGGYLYWENELYEGMLYPSTEVILTYQYSNLEGEYTNITSQSIYLDYNTRNQQFVDFSVFNEYDNGRIVAFVRNKLNNYVNGKEFVGDFVKLEYVLDSDIYYSYSSDTDSNPKQYPIVDYENKNPSYTGGTGGTLLFPGLESDYGWLDGVFNAFGLVGDNGLVQFMGDLFSFIPTPIFVALSGFVFAAIIIALFKMFVK